MWLSCVSRNSSDYRDPNDPMYQYEPADRTGIGHVELAAWASSSKDHRCAIRHARKQRDVRKTRELAAFPARSAVR